MVKIVTTVLCFMLLSDGVYAASSSRECAQSEQQQLENLCCLTPKKMKEIFPVLTNYRVETSEKKSFKLDDEKIRIKTPSNYGLESKCNGNYIEIEYDGKIFSLPLTNSISICTSANKKAYIVKLMGEDSVIDELSIYEKISSNCLTADDLQIMIDELKNCQITTYSKLKMKRNSVDEKYAEIDRLLEEIFQELKEKFKDQKKMKGESPRTTEEKTVAIKELIKNLRNEYSYNNLTKEATFVKLAEIDFKEEFDFKKEFEDPKEAFKELQAYLELQRIIVINNGIVYDFKNYIKSLEISVQALKAMQEYKREGFIKYEKGARYYDYNRRNQYFINTFPKYLDIIELLKSKDKSLYDAIVTKINGEFYPENPLMEHIEIFLEELTKSKFELWSDKMHSITPEFYDFFFSRIKYAHCISKKILFKYLEDDDFLSLFKQYIDEMVFPFEIDITEMVLMLKRDYDFVEKNLDKLFDPSDEVYHCIQDVFEDKEMTREEKISQIKELDEVR